MKIVQINSVLNGSTGMIARNIGNFLNDKGIENYILYSYGNKRDNKQYIQYSDNAYIKFQSLKSHIFGNYGFNSDLSTIKLINQLNFLKPDIVHIHNIHGHDVNLEKFINYLKKNNIKTIWTMHDCWLYTGYCPHYTYERCYKWKEECHDCSPKKRYSFFFDKSKQNFIRKKQLFNDFEDITFVTPSKWLQSEAKQSFLSNKDIRVIHNGIDTSLFCTKPSYFKSEIGIQDKKMVLSIAMNVSERKGFNDLIELSKKLSDDCVLVIVGLSDQLIHKLPKNIIGLPKTENKEQLVDIYNAADAFVNPTHEDNFPTVNLEAMACGTPVATYDVGGSPESIVSGTGIVSKENDIEQLKENIIKLANMKSEITNNCREHAIEQFDTSISNQNYYNLYLEVMEK